MSNLTSWPALSLEGNLITAAKVASIAAPTDNEATQKSYGIRKGLTIRDEISTAFRVGQSHFLSFFENPQPSAVATQRFVLDFLTETFGFDDLDHHDSPIAFLAGQRVPIVVTPPSDEKLDRKSHALSTDRTRSAAYALQDFLNAEEDSLWGIATNGRLLRLMRDNASLTRPAYIEADLEQIFLNDDVASFTALWLLIHRSRFGKTGTPSTDCELERWRDAGAKEGIAARDRLALQVEEALRILGSGFLSTNPQISERLRTGQLPLTDWFNELLRLVYRLIFLMVAEDRGLLHPLDGETQPVKNSEEKTDEYGDEPPTTGTTRRSSSTIRAAAGSSLYQQGYSLAHLRRACTHRSAWNRHHDRYEGMKIVFHALAHGEPRLALPALGGLFSDDQLPHLDSAKLPNAAFMEALFQLSWLKEKSSIVPINWRAMETEELGSVYESLLELQPQLSADARQLLFASDTTEQRGNQRKLTGSYYTPDSLVQALLDSTLDPVLDQIDRDAWQLACCDWKIEQGGEWRIANSEWKELAAKYRHVVPRYFAALQQLQQAQHPADDQRLQRTGNLATRARTSEDGLPADQVLSSGRDVRHDLSDPSSSHLHSGKYSGRLGAPLPGGVHSIPEDSQRQSQGAGNPPDSLSGRGSLSRASDPAPDTGMPHLGQTNPSPSKEPTKQKALTSPTDNPPSIPAATGGSSIRHSPFTIHAATGGPHLFAAQALLSLSILDPACGSGHFLLAAARRIATRLARYRSDGTPSAEDYRHALRDVARHCLYGVDINPMAVELAKVALWIETVDPGKPLGFFDAQIRCGNALLGVYDLDTLKEGIPDDAYEALTGDDKDTATAYKKANKEAKRGQGEFNFGGTSGSRLSAKPIATDFSSLRELPEDKLSDINEKAAHYRQLRHSAAFRRIATACDLYISAYLLPKSGPIPATADQRTIPTTEETWRALQDDQLPARIAHAPKAARRARAFHWPLEFPNVMAKGGFDVVLGNPPWEVMQLSDKEYFAMRKPEIAALSGAERKRAIEELKHSDPEAYFDFSITKRSYDAENTFSRSSGRFELTACGKVNTYALFAELFSHSGRQRTGIIVPTGIATDATTAPFFAHLVAEKRLARLIDFENSAPLFISVHRSFKFSLLSLGHDEPNAHFAFFLTDPAQLADSERNFSLSPEEIALLNPNTQTAPVFRSRADAELTTKIYRKVPVLIDESKGRPKKGRKRNPWGISFSQGLFNMTSASHLFHTATQLAGENWTADGTFWTKDGRRMLPLYEAKMIHQFDHRWATYETSNAAAPSSRDLTTEEKQDPSFEPAPRYWVAEHEVESKLLSKHALSEFYSAQRREDTAHLAILFRLWLMGHALLEADSKSLSLLRKEIDESRACGYTAQAMVLLYQNEERLYPKIATQYPLTPQERELLWQQIRADGGTTLMTPDIMGAKTSEDYSPHWLTLAQQILPQRQHKWLMGWRDICRATDERTVIASVVPRAGVGHTLPLFYSSSDAARQAAFLANLNSLILDFTARQAVGGTHLTYGYLKQFPVLAPDFYTQSDLDFIVPRVLELTYTSESLRPFYEDVLHSWQASTVRRSPLTVRAASGGPRSPFPWDEERRSQLRAELDAYYAKLYGLDRDELRYILDPADIKGTDYPSETFRVLKEKEIRDHNEYRTQRLILEAWDRFEADGTFGSPEAESDTTNQDCLVTISIPELSSLPALQWAWPDSRKQKDRLRYSAQYALWIYDPAIDAEYLRYVVACLAEPFLLTILLSPDQQKQWTRLTGPDAAPLPDNMIRMTPKTSEAWRSAYTSLITSGQLEEDDEWHWRRGRSFDSSMLTADSPMAYRTAFVLQTIRRARAQMQLSKINEKNSTILRLLSDAS